MRKFSFRLESALTLRRHEKQQAALALAQAARRSAQLRTQLEQVAQSLIEAQAVMHPKPGESVKAGELMSRQQTVAYYCDQHVSAESRHSEARKEEEACRNLVLEARRREEGVERLRTQAVERHRRELDQADELALHEFVAAQHFRRTV